MKLSEVQWIFTKNIAKLIIFAESNGFMLTFGEAERTASQQWMYVNGYAISGGRLVKAPKISTTYYSKHLKRLAVDFNIFYAGELTYDFDICKILGDYWESLHPLNRWGGDFNKNDKDDDLFKDKPHFEMDY